VFEGTATVTELVVAADVPEVHDNPNVVVCAIGPTSSVPLAAFAPVQPPVAVHVVPSEFHVSKALCPEATRPTSEDIITVGGDEDGGGAGGCGAGGAGEPPLLPPPPPQEASSSDTKHNKRMRAARPCEAMDGLLLNPLPRSLFASLSRCMRGKRRRRGYRVSGVLSEEKSEVKVKKPSRNAT
jgi:hypothetical protein